MAFTVPMPQIGESIHEVTLIRWCKQPGDRVARDETLCILNTDKSEMDLPSPVAGIVQELRVAEGELVRIGTVIATVEENAVESVEARISVNREASEAPEAPPPHLAPAGAGAPKPRAGRIFTSPMVRRLARELALDLSVIPGTGRGGRVSRRDVEKFLADRKGTTETTSLPSPLHSPTGISSPTAFSANASGLPQEVFTRFAPVPDEGDRVEAMTPTRRAIFDHMSLTWQVSPHVHAVTEVDMSRIQALRTAHGAAFEARTGMKLTITPFLAQALVRTLQQHPRLNASVTAARELILRRGIHLGVAVALADGGLVVPVVKNAQDYSLEGLARKIHELAEKARNKKLQPDEMRGGTFTLSNLGVFGNLMGMPLLNQPQVGIVGLGAVQKRVVVLEDQGDAIAVRPMAYVTLGYDHRAVDGSASGAFLKEFRGRVNGFDEELGG